MNFLSRLAASLAPHKKKAAAVGGATVLALGFTGGLAKQNNYWWFKKKAQVQVGFVANAWVNTSAGGTPTRSGSLLAYNSSNAYGDISSAYAASFPGDVICINGGTYPAQPILKSVTNGKPATTPVVIKACGAVTINGDLTVGPLAQNADVPDYVTIDGNNTMIVNGHYKASYWTTQPDHETVLNTHFQIPLTTSAQSSLIFTRSASNLVVRGNEVGPACCSSDGISAEIANNGQPVPSNVSVIGNYVHDLYDTCTEVPTYLGSCTVPANESFGSGTCSVGNCDHVDMFQSFGCNTCSINGNVAYLQGDHKQGIFLGNGNGATYSNITVANNLIHVANSDTALGSPGNDAAPGPSGYIKYYYNTVVGTFSFYTGANAALRPAPGTTVEMVGNIFVGQAGNSSGGGCTGFTYSDGTSFTPTWRNNSFSARAGCDASDLGNLTPTFVASAWPGAGTCQTGNLTGCSSTTGVPNLHLSGPQTVDNAGETTVCTVTVTSDVDAESRPKGAGCDLGGDEDR